MHVQVACMQQARINLRGHKAKGVCGGGCWIIVPKDKSSASGMSITHSPKFLN